jgi:hypothetical protein
MNGKPDEHFDQGVRQSLDRLPDAPPPGTNFDAERLWRQLQPELQKPITRWRGWVGWAAAACVMGLLLLGWLSIDQQPTVNYRIVSRTERLAPPTAINRKPKITIRNDRSEPAYSAKTHLSSPYRTGQLERIAEAAPLVLLETEPAQPVADVTEPLRIMDTASSGLIGSKPIKITAVAAHKRRFRVVHLNELLTEEEARPKFYRTEGFVRLGTGRQDGPIHDEPTAAIILPLTSKTNQ